MAKHQSSNDRNKFYCSDIPDSMKASLKEIERLKKSIDEKKPLCPDVWQTIQEKLRIDWTYDSNAIEGSTLTRGETMFFLQEGLTAEGKPFKDFLDAKNHAEAIEYLFEIIKNERPLNAGLVKELNALLLKGVTATSAVNQFGQNIQKPAHPGTYKKQPNHVQQFDGSIHYYTDPLHVQDEMDVLISWIYEQLPTLHPVIVAAISHYNLARIHPFDDGNGRVARLLMNFVLMKAGYPPAVIRNENRREYMDCLSQADSGNISPFIGFTCISLKDTLESILLDLQAGKQPN
ncbi:MAG: Fic family protein [Candidatus Margulisbacteria bacterium]|nr:Fic family protein [Candidatus Margulisiibacteriota bacterium]